MTTRTASGTGGTTATLSYDGQDHLVRWNDTNTTTNEEWYMYDASGQRVLRRSQTGTGNSNTRYTLTAFGLEDHIYDGGGSHLNDKYYYSLAGRLIGLNNGNTNFLFTDALGSVVSSITASATNASVKGNQVYGSYGNSSYSKGNLGTTKGYTGQYNDSLTQLDYYGARYYDPLVGVFLSADKVQGNLQGMDPYSYAGENPETLTDPSGQMIADFGEGGGGVDAGEAAAFESGSGGSDASSFTPIPYFSPEPSSVEAGDTTINYDSNTGELTTQVENADGSTTWSEVEPGTQAYSNDLQTFESLSEGSPDESANAFAEGQTVEGGPTEIGEGSDTGLSSTQSSGPETTSPGENTPGSTEGNTTNTTSTNLEVRVSQKGLDTVKTHLSRSDFTDPYTGEPGTESPENASMLQRLEEALNQGNTISGTDANFYFHELYESTLMDRGLSYEDAHEQALDRYGVPPFAIYHPDIIQSLPDLFNQAWFDFWGILP